MSTALENPQRYHALDLLRAVMMFLGLVLHSAQMYMSMDVAVDYYWDAHRSLSMDVVLILINTFRMPTFYVLAGFFTALLIERRGVAAMLRNRRDRVLVPFIVCLPVLALSMTLLKILGANWQATGTWSLDRSAAHFEHSWWDNTHDLWFLYYLMMFIGTAAIFFVLPQSVRQRLERLVIPEGMSWVPWVLAVVVLAALGYGPEVGRVSPDLRFAPSLSVYLYYLVAFGLGFVVFHHQSMLTPLRRNFVWLGGLALASLGGALVGFLLQGTPGSPGYTPLHILLSLGTAMSTVAFIAAFIGGFLRFFDHYNPRARYLSDSAYWVFISHAPVQVVTAIAMAHWNMFAEVKFAVVVMVSFGVCLLTYEYCVRSTAIGVMLNGQRFPKGLPRR